MFSGLVQGTGKIHGIKMQGETIELTIEPQNSDFLKQVKIGDSIAINGTCLTVTSRGQNLCQTTLMPQTYEKTTFKDFKKGA